MKLPEGVKITRASFEFYQEGNTMGTTEDVEGLTVELEYQLTTEEGPFVVIKTPGWSFDDDDLNNLIQACKDTVA